MSQKTKPHDAILVPLDGSDLARAILGPVGLLGRAFGWRVEATRVLDPYEVDEALLRGQDIFGDVRDELAASIEPLQTLGLAAHAETLEGEPAKRILAYAEELDPALIAIATHGRTGADRIAHGSVAERVIRGARHPVYVANPKGIAAGIRSVARILVPLDGSERSELAVPLADRWARALGAEIVLFPALDESSPFPSPARAEERLGAIASRLGVRARIIVQKASAAYGILSTARVEGVDLIAIATHGRTGAARWLFGSTAEHVLAHAHAPLLVLRTVRAAEPAPESAQRR